MLSPEPTVAIRDAIRHWSRLAELAEFAVARHGYGNTDCGFGVTYPSDLDEYDREVDGVRIPNGSVQVYGFWGPPDGYELLVGETEYLQTLEAVLSAAGHLTEAERVRAMLVRLGSG